MSLEAVLLEKSPRFEEWMEVFGGNRVPVRNAVPKKTNLPGLGKKEVYLLDVEALSAEQRSRLTEHLARKFNLPVDLVGNQIEQYGVPLLAEDVYVPMDLRFFL